jgi:hypothetical protein
MCAHRGHREESDQQPDHKNVLPDDSSSVRMKLTSLMLTELTNPTIVDFPLPEAPTSAVTFPAGMKRFMSLITSTAGLLG